MKTAARRAARPPLSRQARGAGRRVRRPPGEHDDRPAAPVRGGRPFIPMGQPLTTSASVTSPPPPAPRGVEWIGLEEAAKRTGWGVRHLRRLCGGEWHARGLARSERPPGGGKPAWLVREDA